MTDKETTHEEALAYVMGKTYAHEESDAKETLETQNLQEIPKGDGESAKLEVQAIPRVPSNGMGEENTVAREDQDTSPESAPKSEATPKKKSKKLPIVIAVSAVFLCVCVGVAWAAHVSVHNYIDEINARNEQSAQALAEWESARSVSLENITENGQQIDTYGLASMGASEGEKDSHVQKIETLVDEYGKKGLISFEAYSLEGNSALSYNTELDHYSACTIKAPYIYWCCQQLEAGKGNLWDTMTFKAEYAFPGSGTIQYSDYGTQYSIADLIYYALFISDNTAYNMLHVYFGGENTYNSWIVSEGMPSLVVEGLWGYNIKASDLTKIWKLYYEYFQTSQSDIRDALYKACTNSYAAFACQHMPYTYSHKSGNTYYPDEQYNDAGIIWIEGHPYVFAFLSKTEGVGWDSGVICEIMNEISALMSKEDPQPNAPEVSQAQWTWEGWLAWLIGRE